MVRYVYFGPDIEWASRFQSLKGAAGRHASTRAAWVASRSHSCSVSLSQWLEQQGGAGGEAAEDRPTSGRWDQEQ